MSTTAETKERPIIMSAESVRAVLAGRKTEARRAVEPQPPDGFSLHGPERYHIPRETEDGNKYFSFPADEAFGLWSYGDGWNAPCPYGRPGDLLWVQESFRLHQDFEAWSAIEFVERESGFVVANGPVYEADGMRKSAAHGIIKHRDKADRGRKRLPEDLPRELCRLRLRVEEVRVERVQESREWEWVVEFSRIEE